MGAALGDDAELRQGFALRADGGVRVGSVRFGGVFLMHLVNDWARQETSFGGISGGSSTEGWFSSYMTGPSVGFRADLGDVGVVGEASVLGGPGHVVRVTSSGDTEDVYRPSLALGGSIAIDLPVSSSFALALSASLYALLREDGPPTLVPIIRFVNEWH